MLLRYILRISWDGGENLQMQKSYRIVSETDLAMFPLCLLFILFLMPCWYLRFTYNFKCRFENFSLMSHSSLPEISAGFHYILFVSLVNKEDNEWSSEQLYPFPILCGCMSALITTSVCVAFWTIRGGSFEWDLKWGKLRRHKNDRTCWTKTFSWEILEYTGVITRGSLSILNNRNSVI